MAGDWRCKITNNFVICTALRKDIYGTHKIKAKIFLDGEIHIFIKYPIFDGKSASKHFTKRAENIDSSNMTLVLDNFGPITARQVEVFS